MKPGFSHFPLFFFLLTASVAFAIEPIKPLPRSISYNKAKAELGKQLFMDPNLSKDRTTSCASCHNVYFGGADSRPVSIGVDMQKGTINAPTVLNSFFNFRQFWDGRAKNLKEQAAGPLHNPKEMAFSKAEAINYLHSESHYRKQFKQVYQRDEIQFADILDAIAEFEKALLTPDAKFDQYLRGEIELSEREHAGYLLFKRLGCASCHNGVNVGGNSYQYMGVIVPYDKETLTGDVYGRTNDPFDRNRYKVPTLRNITLTAPYMHTGGIEKLEEMVDTMAYYNIGLKLSEEEIDLIIAFLETLTGETPDILKQP